MKLLIGIQQTMNNRNINLLHEGAIMNYSEDINSEITDGKDLSNYQEEVKNRILRTREVDKYD